MAESIDKIALIYIRNRRVLCTRSKGKDVYYMPGGKRERGETDSESLVRELREELSVELVTNTLKRMHVFEAQAHGRPPGTMLKMTCYTGEFNGVPKPSSEVEEIAWLDCADFDRLTDVGRLIFSWLKERKLIE